MENSNIDGAFLNCSKLQLNKKGVAFFTWNIAIAVKYIWSAPNCDGEFTDTKNSGNDEKSGLDSLNAGSLQNLKNM